MNAIHCEMHEDIALLRLDKGVTNPIGMDLVQELDRTLQGVASESRGLILSGGEKFFSIGFDLPALLQLDRAGNEIGIGVPVPYLADMLLSRHIGHQAAAKMMYTGDFISSKQAETLGLVDETLARDQLQARALEKIQRFSSAPSPAFAMIKANRLESITKRFEKNFPGKFQAFLDIWFNPNTQALLTRAAEKF